MPILPRNSPAKLEAGEEDGRRADDERAAEADEDKRGRRAGIGRGASVGPWRLGGHAAPTGNN